MACSSVSSSSLSDPTARTSVHPSVQIRSLADKTIAYLEEKPLSLRVHAQQTELSLSLEEQLQIREEWQLHRATLLKKKSAGKFIYLSKGSSHLVFTHQQFPQWVFKRMRSSTAKDQEGFVRKAIELINRFNLFCIRIPPGTTLSLEDPNSVKYDVETLYIEERLPIGLSTAEYEELYDRLLSYFSTVATDTFRTNFEKMIRQASLFIQKSNYWDVGPHNGPLLNTETGSEFLFIDFEQQGDGLSIHNSPLDALLELFPHPKIRESLTALHPSLDALSKFVSEQLKEYERMHLLKARALSVWDSKGWTLEETSKSETQISTTLTDPDAIAIIEKINEHLINTACPIKCFTKSRYVRLKPGIDFGPKDPSLWSEELFKQTLEPLQREGSIINWHFKSIGWIPAFQPTLLLLYC
jgi:hypothetical protein